MGFVLGELITAEKMDEMLQMDDRDFKLLIEGVIETEIALDVDLQLRGNAYWVVRDGVKVRIDPLDVSIRGADYVVAGDEELKHVAYILPRGMRGVSPINNVSRETNGGED